MKGNIPIPKDQARAIENGKIIKDLPLVPFRDTYLPLFTVISPDKCKVCGSSLKAHKSYFRYILSSFDLLQIPVTSHRCINKECKAFQSDKILGVDGSDNYSEEYNDKEYHVRYKGKCSLNNTHTVGGIFTKDTGHSGRAPCPATLWKYDQKEGKISLERIQKTDVNLTGTIYIDGIWIKTGYKKTLEKLLGRDLTRTQWKKLRYKVVYVIATEDKVVLDLEITNRCPSYLELLPLFLRIKRRFDEGKIKRIVSDEEDAIILAGKTVFPKANQSFCIFHQLQNYLGIFLDAYKSIDNIPRPDKIFFDLFEKVLRSTNVIEATCYLRNAEEFMKNHEISKVVEKAHRFARDKFFKNTRLLQAGMVPETNNTMEQIFSTIKDFIIQCRSFKIVSGLKNWISSLFCMKNSAPFYTGRNKGFSPLEINRRKAYLVT